MKINEAPFPLSSSHLDNNILFSLIKENSDFAAALVYLASYEKHKTLNIIPRGHSIEISNEQIIVAVILYVGFKKNEYLEMKDKKKLHLITFSDVIPRMIEFKELKIKHVDKMAWLFRILHDSKSKKLESLKRIKMLNID